MNVENTWQISTKRPDIGSGGSTTRFTCIRRNGKNPSVMTSLRQKLADGYMWLIVLAGVIVCSYSGYSLSAAIIDPYFLLLVLLTVVVGSRVGIRIPQINTNIT